MVAYLQMYALTESPTIYVSLIEQFWQTAIASTLENGDMEITATIDGKVKVVSEASIRIHLLEYISRSTTPVESHHTPIVAPLTSQTHHSPTLKDFIRRETEVPHPSSSTQTHVADEAASIGIDVRHGGAATTISSLDAGRGSGNIDKTPAMPHDSPLPRSHTLGSDKGRMQHNELMDLVTKLSNRIVSLETDLQQTKKVYGDAYTKLIKKVKMLEHKLNKSRRKRRLVLSKEEDSDTKILANEDPSKQGRKIAQIEADEELAHSSKRQKIGEGSEPAEELKDKESDELSQEKLQQLMIIVPEEGMNVKALQKNTQSLTGKFTLKIQECIRRSSDIHHVSIKRGHDIFMLVEKDYPLTRRIITLMLYFVMSDSEHSTVNYTLISSDYKEPSDVGSLRVMVYVYDRLPMHPPSPNYVPRPEHPPSPDYFMLPEDDVFLAEEQPLPAAVSPITDSPSYITESDPEWDPKEEDDEDPKEDLIDYPTNKDDVEEEDHLAPANSIPPPQIGTHGARMTVQPQPPITTSTEALIAIVAATLPLPSPPPLPLTSYSSPLPQIPSPPFLVPSPPTTSPTYTEAPLGYMAAVIRLRTSSPPPLPLSSPLPLPPPIILPCTKASMVLIRAC
ncbi:hypothetical protein Tco_0664593 [Tanacetum coccineum]